jgi:DNA-binding beta-propeller fold protein YncE
VRGLATSALTFVALTAVSGCSDRADRFARPTAVAFASNGDVLVSDGYDNARVVRLTPAGAVVTEWGSRGIAPGQFQTPHGIATGPDGRIFVADRENARIQVFDGNHKFVAEWKGERIGRPWAVATDRAGNVYAVDGGDQTAARPRGGVVKLSPDGVVLARFGTYGRAPGQLDWGHGIAVGKDGAVYVGDLEGRRVQKWVPR